MQEEVKVKIADVKELFSLLEQLNAFFHSPGHYRNVDEVINFVEGGAYEKIQKAYYHTVWNWLPREVQLELENRPSPFE